MSDIRKTMSEFQTMEYYNFCPLCKGPNKLILPVDGYLRWTAGVNIAIAFPTMSLADRETLITGYHDKCWDLTMKDEEY